EGHEIVVQLEEHGNVCEHDVVRIERDDVRVDADGEGAALLRRLPPRNRLASRLEEGARGAGDGGQAEGGSAGEARARSVGCPAGELLVQGRPPAGACAGACPGASRMKSLTSSCLRRVRSGRGPEARAPPPSGGQPVPRAREDARFRWSKASTSGSRARPS